MNIYLEKIASLGEELGKVKEPEKAVSPGSKLIHGAKTLFNHAQIKTAEESNTTKDAVNTSIIGGLGGAAGFASHKIIKNVPKVFGESTKFHNAKVIALGTGLGLAADYAGIKLNNSINKHLDKVASIFPSVKYQKTLNEDEGKRYRQEYLFAPNKHIGQTFGSSMAVGLGTVAGLQAGATLAKPLGQKLAEKIKNHGIISGKYRMADGSHNLQHILHDGVKVRRGMNTVLPIAGAMLGSIPGASWSDHFRHNHAKNVIEKRRNTNND